MVWEHCTRRTGEQQALPAAGPPVGRQGSVWAGSPRWLQRTDVLTETKEVSELGTRPLFNIQGTEEGSGSHSEVEWLGGEQGGAG